MVSTPMGERIFTLKTAEHPYRVFFEAMNEGAATLTGDGDILYCNKRLADLAGVPLSNLVASRFIDLIDRPERQAVSGLIAKGGDGVANLETSLRTPGGKIIPVNISVSPLKTEEMEYVCGVITDLSDVAAMKKLEQLNEELRVNTEELHASEEQLKASEEIAKRNARELEGVILQLAQPVLIYDKKGELVKFNPAVIEAFGLDLTSIDSKDYFEVLKKINLRYPDGLGIPLNEFPSRRALRGNNVVNEQILFTDIRGKDHAIRVSARPLYLEGEIIGSVVVWNDVTEMMDAQKAITKLNDDLIQRNAELISLNKELEEFAYSISHDLRAPLRVMEGLSGVVFEDYSGMLDESGKTHLESIKRNAKKMDDLILGLLSLTKIGRHPMKISEVDCEKLARDVAAECTAAFPGREIYVNVTPMLKAEADPVLLRQVFVNLLSNAIKFSSDRDSTRIEVGGGRSADENTYYVKDNGVGFDMKYARKIFGVFQRLHARKEYEGTGVGLSIVSKIIQKHGGRVWAEGKLNQGSTFFFTLPKRR